MGEEPLKWIVKCQVTFDWVEGEGCCSYTFASSTLPRVFLWNNPELLFLLCKLAKVRNFKALYFGSEAILRKKQKYTHCNKWDQNKRFSGCQNVHKVLGGLSNIHCCNPGQLCRHWCYQSDGTGDTTIQNRVPSDN